MSSNRIIAIIIVALIHVLVGYALVTGLAYSAIQKAVERVTTVDIKEPPPPEDEPPPPEPEPQPESSPPPIVAPPPPVNLNLSPPPVPTQTNIPPPAPPAVRLPPPAPVAPPAPPPAPPPPPPPKVAAKKATPRGNPASWANANDYPSRSLREEKEGVTRFTVQIGTDGRVTSCNVTGSSGTPELDSTTCSLIQRRARFSPAIGSDGQPTTDTWSSSVRWQIPK